jgi:hypothetical protein
MPTRKQRRRRQKERRHEWEYVYVDDEGREVAAEEEEREDARPAKSAKTPARTGGKASSGARQPAGRAGRKVDPPSWRRVYRRAAIFAPIMLIVVYLLRPKSATAASVALQVIVLLLFFLPFSYLMDSLMYRSYRKRIGDPLPPRQRKQRSR